MIIQRIMPPGTIEGNWKWQFSWNQLTDEQAGRLLNLVKMFSR
jgi:4-alpha-glucanotransferase